MPINIDLAPPPQFERSMIGYVTTNFGRIRDALLRVMPTSYQTGEVILTWAAEGVKNFNVPFPIQFNAALGTGPNVIITKVGPGSDPALHGRVYACNNVGFNVQVDTFSTILTGSWKFRWLAFYA
jgi:hypothetical protein